MQDNLLQNQQQSATAPGRKNSNLDKDNLSPDSKVFNATGKAGFKPASRSLAGAFSNLANGSAFSGSSAQMKSANQPAQQMVDKDVKEEEKKVQMKAGNGQSTGGNTASQSGSLPSSVLGKMEGAFNTSFSDVKVHNNSSSATNMGALAYAQGNDIHFAPGQYNPNSTKGQELIGHELTHVVQQRQGRVKANTQAKGTPVNDDPRLEKEADDMGKKAAKGCIKLNNTERPNSRTSSNVTQGYFKDVKGKENYRVADDLSAAVREGYPNHVLYLASGKVSDSNAKLKAVSSGISLKEESSTMEFSSGAKKKALKKVLPENNKNATKGDKMQLWADCGKSSGVVVGSNSRVGVYKSPLGGGIETTSATSPAMMKAEIMKAWLENTYKGTSSSKKIEIKKVLDANAKIELEIKSLVADYGKASSSADKEKIAKEYHQKNSKRAEVLYLYYNSLPSTEQNLIDEELGVNRFAIPEIGEGYTMSSGGNPISGYESNTWNFHWGGVVAESDDKNDKVTLENYAVGDPSVENKLWDFAMYGIFKAGQTFHDQHKGTNQHGESPTTIRIKKQ